MRTLASVVLALGVTAALVPLASAASPADKCVRYWGEARYAALGYNHLVHLANVCAAAADCVVSTDVNPQEQNVALGGKSETVVNTFVGSPARAFTPRVKCTMREE